MPRVQTLVCCVIVALATLTSTAQASDENIQTLTALKSRVAAIHRDSNSTALGIAVVEKGQAVWVEALGLADVEAQRPAGPDSAFPVGSLAKMLVSLSVLTLVDEGKLSLETPLRELSPDIGFHNPWENTDPIRVAHLLEHTTGWPDMSYAEYSRPGSDFPTLRAALMAYPERRRSRWIPGTRMAYSNIGPTVAALIVEEISGLPFETYAQRRLLAPLDMSDTGFSPPREARQAHAYQNGIKQREMDPIYPPSGPLYASTQDMAKLLQLFLQRGKSPLAGAQLISAPLIERMETPKTTLANDHEVTAGYGLGNRSDGFRAYQVDFHGHDGGIPGAMATFYYAPELQSGYFVAVTGNSSGARALAEAVRSYLLRHRTALSTEQAPRLKESQQSLSGTYRQLNHPVDFMDFVPEAFSAATLSVEGNALRQSSFNGGTLRTYVAKHSSLIDMSSGLPAIAPVEDPLVGPTLQIGSTLYQETSKGWLWVELGYWVLIALASAIAVFVAVIRTPVQLYRKRLFQRRTLVSIWPVMASGSFLLAALYPILSPLDITQITPWSGPATFLFGATLAYGLFSALGVISLTILRTMAFGTIKKTAIITLTLLHASMAMYLSAHGVIGMTLWTW